MSVGGSGVSAVPMPDGVEHGSWNNTANWPPLEKSSRSSRSFFIPSDELEMKFHQSELCRTPASNDATLLNSFCFFFTCRFHTEITVTIVRL